MEFAPPVSPLKDGVKSGDEVFSNNVFEWVRSNPVVKIEDLVV